MELESWQHAELQKLLKEKPDNDTLADDVEDDEDSMGVGAQVNIPEMAEIAVDDPQHKHWMVNSRGNQKQDQAYQREKEDTDPSREKESQGYDVVKENDNKQEKQEKEIGSDQTSARSQQSHRRLGDQKGHHKDKRWNKVAANSAWKTIAIQKDRKEKQCDCNLWH